MCSARQNVAASKRVLAWRHQNVVTIRCVLCSLSVHWVLRVDFAYSMAAVGVLKPIILIALEKSSILRRPSVPRSGSRCVFKTSSCSRSSKTVSRISTPCTIEREG